MGLNNQTDDGNISDQHLNTDNNSRRQKANLDGIILSMIVVFVN